MQQQSEWSQSGGGFRQWLCTHSRLIQEVSQWGLVTGGHGAERKKKTRRMTCPPKWTALSFAGIDALEGGPGLRKHDEGLGYVEVF